MAKKETIKLFDFITEAIKAGNWDIDIPEEETYFTYECPDGKRYDESTKFSPETGEPISKVEHTREASYDDRTTKDVLYALEDESPEGFDFEYVTSVEKRSDDANGYFNHMIFKRKSDGQHFYYCSYDGRIDENYLEPTEKIVVESWDFEKYFM
jgi:hypothetical protein